MVTKLKLTLTIEHRSVAQRSVTIQQVFHELSCFRSSKEKGWKKTRRKKMTRGKHKKNPLSQSQVVHYMLCCNAGICAPTDLVLLSAAGLTLCDIRACCVDKEGIKQRCFLSQPCLTAADTDLFTTTLTHVCSITSSRNTCASPSLCKSTQRIFVFCHFSLQTVGNDVSQREDNQPIIDQLIKGTTILLIS